MSGLIKYRSDIDGLRAIAVLSVMLYHFKTGLLGGGFVGVDVFFVISGYLITTIITREMAEGRFSFLRFYERRIRRIFPAFFFMLAVSVVAGFFLLYPLELVDLAKNAIASVLFASNFYLYSVNSYFNSDMALKPLLHTWSLAVEEQYYLVFPLLLFMVFRANRKLVPAIVLILFLLSFAADIAALYIDSSAAFYFSPLRFWEMMAGSLLAVMPLPRLSWRPAREAVAFGGLALILAAAFLYKPMMIFPGHYAAAPVAGAAAIIYAGGHGQTLTGRFLSLRPMVFIGLLSYSLYLWHWPVTVYYHLYMNRPPQPQDTIFLLPVTVIMSLVSWRFVEEPLRHNRAFYGRPLWTSNLGLSAVAVAAAAGIVLASGFPGRYDAQTDRFASYLRYDDVSEYRRGTCFLDGLKNTPADFDAATCLHHSGQKPGWLLIGDSHGAHWWKGLSGKLTDVELMQATSSGCKPLASGPGLKNCRAFFEEIYAKIPSLPIKAVVISARWDTIDLANLLSSIALLRKYGLDVYVLGPIAEYEISLARLLAEEHRRDLPGYPGERLTPSIKEIDERFADALKDSGAVYVSAYDALCPAPARQCRTLAEGGVPMQWDYGHLTGPGSDDLAAVVVPALKSRTGSGG